MLSGEILIRYTVHDVRVTTVTVGNKFEQKRALAAYNPFLGVLHSLENRNDVHSIALHGPNISEHPSCRGMETGAYLNTGDFVTASVVLGVGRATLRRGTHTVLVVLANEDNREIPKFCLPKHPPVNSRTQNKQY